MTHIRLWHKAYSLPFQCKTHSYQYRDFQWDGRENTVHNGNSYTGKTKLLLQIKPLFPISSWGFKAPTLSAWIYPTCEDSVDIREVNSCRLSSHVTNIWSLYVMNWQRKLETNWRWPFDSIQLLSYSLSGRNISFWTIISLVWLNVAYNRNDNVQAFANIVYLTSGFAL